MSITERIRRAATGILVLALLFSVWVKDSVVNLFGLDDD